MIRYIGKRFFVRLVLLTAIILGVVGLFSWAEGGPTKKLGLSPFQEPFRIPASVASVMLSVLPMGRRMQEIRRS